MTPTIASLTAIASTITIALASIAASVSTATGPATTSSSSSHPVHVFLLHSFPNFNPGPINIVLPLQDDPVHRVVVVKLDKPEAPLLASGLVSQHSNTGGGSKLGEILLQVVLLEVSQASYKDLLH